MKLPFGIETDKFDPAKELSRKIAHSGLQKKAFLLADEGQLEENCAKWTTQLPLIQPYFDVTCNACPWLLESLSALKVKFSCSSKAEFQHVLAQGVEPGHILFSPPVKVASHIKAAVASNIDLLAFDSLHELKKLAKAAPKTRLILNLHQQSDHQDWPSLLKAASDLDLQVVGVTLQEGECLNKRVALARVVFAVATSLGHNMTILDLGPLDHLGLGDIMLSLDKHFQGHLNQGLQVFGHLGASFIQNVFSCGAKVIGKSTSALVINDGIFHSFGRLMVDDAYSVESSVMALAKTEKANGQVFNIFGSSGDDMDVVAQDQVLDEQVEEEDWLYFPNMGAFSFGLEANMASVALPPKFGKFRMFTPEVSSLQKPFEDGEEGRKVFGLENDENEEVTVEVIFLDILGSNPDSDNEQEFIDEERVNLFEELPNNLHDFEGEDLWEEFYTNLY